MKITIKHMIANLLIAMLLMNACSDQEFLPPAIGEPIPFEDKNLKRLDEILGTDNNQLFAKVWKKSNLKPMFAEKKANYTLLLPSNAAMEKAGYNQSRIDAMDANSADSLIWYYTFAEEITKQNLTDAIGNIKYLSLLKNTNWQILRPYSYQFGYLPYQYAHYMKVTDGKLFSNGIEIGKADDSYPVANGYVWPIQEMIKVPTLDFYDVFEKDPRFSMCIEIKKRSDDIHDQNFRKLFKEINRYETGKYRDNSRLYYNNWAKPITKNVLYDTMFLPTNDAFKAAGFQSVDDVIEWNKRAPALKLKQYTSSSYEGGFPSDTIINYHIGWGRENQLYNPLFGKTEGPTPTVFYANDLKSDWISSYLVNKGSNNFQLVMPFYFATNDKGQVQVWLKESNAPKATIVETIQTVQGPVHVVDRLFIPKDFKIK